MRRNWIWLPWMLLCASTLTFTASADEPSADAVEVAPERVEGEGPFDRLILRGAILIDGTGAPPTGPVDIVIEGNRITDIQSVGFPGVAIDPDGRPEADDDTREIDVEGMYVLPGFVDTHGHIGGANQGTPAEYVFKLWLGHGVTTIRDPGSGNGLGWTLDHKRKSATNEITAPRIQAYARFGLGRAEPFTSPVQAREWVREVGADGADGLKFFGARPDILQAAIEEAAALGLHTTMHHAQLGVTRADALTTARWGLDSMEHWYGLPEALFTDRRIQDYPPDYNYMDEYDRFREAGRLWRQAAGPDSERWAAVRDELVSLDFTLSPTFNIYQASRDVMRERTAEWHPLYTLPSLWDFFQPDRTAHGSYWFDWTTGDEIDWRRNYQRWMKFVNDYKNSGGRVTVGSDSGFIYRVYGFGYIGELEMLQEAGFHPLEVVRAATLHGAEALGLDADLGTVEPGKLADLVVVGENPVANFKVLYGTGHLRVDEDNEVIRVGGVRYTIKDGIVYDAPALLEDVREMVREAWGREERSLQQPGLAPNGD